MGLFSGLKDIVSDVVGIAAPIAGGLLGGPVGAAAGTALSGLAGTALSSATGQRPSAAGTAADPRLYALPNVPGFENLFGAQMLDVPTLPNRPTSPILPYNIPVLPEARLAPATLGEREAGGALAQSGAAIQALLDPSNTLVNQLEQSEAQLGQQDFLRGLRDVLTQNRRSQSAGRGSLFDGERTDEAVSRMIQTSAAQNRAQARSRAMDRVQGTSRDLQNLASGYSGLANMEQARRGQYQQDLAARINQLRSDVATRTQQRGQQVEQQRQDIGEQTRQQRETMTNFFNLLKGTGPAITGAQADLASRQAGQSAAFAQAAGIPQLAQTGVDYFSKLLGGGSSTPSIPWVNPDTGATAGF